MTATTTTTWSSSCPASASRPRQTCRRSWVHGHAPRLHPGEADFTGIHVAETYEEILYIGDVIHQANIDVDEKGTEAAAATAVEHVGDRRRLAGSRPSGKMITLRLDHPFLFVLRDVETGAVLFMGRVVDPSVER